MHHEHLRCIKNKIDRADLLSRLENIPDRSLERLREDVEGRIQVESQRQPQPTMVYQWRKELKPRASRRIHCE